jgi:hypothetical protein
MDRSEIVDHLRPDDPGWLEEAYRVVREVCLEDEFVTTDQVWPRVVFPLGAAGGKVMGRVFKTAQAERWLEKAKVRGYLLCHDYQDLEPVTTLDGKPIRHQGPVVVYRSLLYPGSGVPPRA